MKHLNSAMTKIKETQFYHNSKFNDNEKLVLKELFKFQNEIFILDIIRMLSVYPGSNELLKSDFIIYLVNFCLKAITDCNDHIINSLSIRILCNLFTIDNARLYISGKRQAILDVLCNLLDSETNTVRVSLSSILVNFSIEFYNKDDNEAKVQILTLISELLSSEKDIKNLTNLYISIANIIHCDKNSLQLAKDLDILEKISSNSNDNNNDEINKELKNYLKCSLK